MKVAIDISPLSTGHKVRGVGFYLKHLKKALEEYPSGIDFQFFTNISEIKKADIIHYPYFDPFTSNSPLRSSISTVVTIHDLTPIKFSKHFPVGMRGNLNWQLSRLFIKNVAAILTDSESSKKDIVTLLSYPEKKVQVAYLAAGDEFKKVPESRVKELKKKYQLPEKFVLYVGDVTWNKNIPRLIKACLLKEIPLVLVGKALATTDFDHKHPWNADLVTVQRLIGSSDLITALGFVNDEDLVGLYNAATLFAMPSLYEGFGLPVIEAMQSGCPVVTSNEGSLLEVGGEAVTYVDAYDVENIAEGIAGVFTSSLLQNELSKKGIERAAQFSWKKTAEQTIAVYKSLLENER